MPEPVFTVIICAYNAASRLGGVFDALSRIRYAHSWEILVVDNASSDGTADVARSRMNEMDDVCVRVVREDTQGLAHARMRGLREADGRYICFVDDDNILAGDYLTQAERILLEHPDVAMITGRSSLPPSRTAPPWFGEVAGCYAVGSIQEQEGLLASGVAPWGAGLVLRAQATSQLLAMSFAPLLLGRAGAVQLAGDDAELCHALAVLGWRAWYSPKLALEHAVSQARLTLPALQKTVSGFGTSSIYIEAYRSLLMHGLKRTVRRSRILFPAWLVFDYLRSLGRMAWAGSPRTSVAYWRSRAAMAGYFLHGFRPGTVYGSAFVVALNAGRGEG